MKKQKRFLDPPLHIHTYSHVVQSDFVLVSPSDRLLSVIGDASRIFKIYYVNHHVFRCDVPVGTLKLFITIEAKAIDNNRGSTQTIVTEVLAENIHC